MTRQVFLHIGLPKTGTTFLQDALWANKPTLGQRGVLVPGRHRRRHLLASVDLREDPKLARRPGDVAHPRHDLVEEVVAWDGPSAVMSHEFFAAASEAQVRRARESFPDTELHVIITARDMVSLDLSRWQEWVKNGGRSDIDAYPRPMSTTRRTSGAGAPSTWQASWIGGAGSSRMSASTLCR